MDHGVCERLCVVMPVYNEQAVIGQVLEKWDAALRRLGVDYEIRPYDDGSKDGSLAAMQLAAQRLGRRISVRSKPNGGHGNTILVGYREAAADGFDWVFQVDSDDEMGPEKFGELWAHRESHDFLVGIRDGREQAPSRRIVSFVSRLCVRAFYGKSVWDVNAPYRLMRVSAFRGFFEALPLTTFAPNVILSGLAARHRLRCFEMRVPQHDRTTGEASIRKWKLLKAAARSFVQTIGFAIRTAGVRDWLRYAFWGVAWMMAVASVAAGFVNGFRELDFQWDPAKLLMLGDNPYAYTLEHKVVPYEGFVEKYTVANQLPSCLLLLAPWTVMPQMTANYVWDVCNLAFTAVFLLSLYRLYFRDAGLADRFYLVPLILLAGMPWRMLIGNGQHLMFSLAFFMPAYACARRGRHVAAGVLLALSAFKYTTIVPLAFVFVAHRWWKPVALAVAAHAVATVGCGIWLGESPVTLVVQSFKVGSMLTAEGVCDPASLARAFGVADVGAWAYAGYAVGAVLLAACALRKRTDGLLLLSVFSVIGDVMFYHRTYDLVVLAFPLVYVLSDAASTPSSRAIRWLTILNIAWIFFIDKACIVLHIPINTVPVCFLLQLGLLVALLARLPRCAGRPRGECTTALP